MEEIKKAKTERERTLKKTRRLFLESQVKRVPQEESGNNVYILLTGKVTPGKCPFGLVTLRSLITL